MKYSIKMPGFSIRKKSAEPKKERVNFGDLRRLQPISRMWGADLGKPIDRYYIEQFLAKNYDDIKGGVLEFYNSDYTKKFGGKLVIKSDVLNKDGDIPGTTIVADLSKAVDVKSGAFDCIIFTQVLQYIYDFEAAVSNIHSMLKPGGVVLATFPVAAKVDKTWTEYWRFTSFSLKKIFQEFFPGKNVTVESYGNILSSVAFLYGIPAEELSRDELEYKDPEYEMLVTVRAKKAF